MVKHILKIAIILAGITAMPGWASIMVGGTDVGSVDSLLGVNALLGSPTDELNWVNSLVSPDTTYSTKISNVSAVPATGSSDPLLAFDLSPYSPDYFLVKNATAVALFQNLDDMMWGVINLDEINTALAGLGDICPGGKACKINLNDKGTVISHISLFGGGNDVPEPGILGLLGIGLFGIVLARRRVRA